MKKILLLFMMCALLPMAGRAQELDGTFAISDIFYDSYFNSYAFNISIVSSTTTYSSYNLDVFLPTGITVKKDGSNKNMVDMPEDDSIYPSVSGRTGKTYTHTISSNILAGNDLRIACASQESEDFTKANGTIVEVCIEIDESAFNSSFSPKPIVKLSGLNLTTSAAVKYVPADFACRPFTTGIPTSRTLSVNVSAANKVGTLILPFDAELPSGLKAYTCEALDGDLLTLTPAASIEACKPYIVYAENGYSGNLSGTAELSDANNVTDIFADGYLTGVLTGTTVNTGYILQKQGSVPMFYDAEDVNFSLPAGRCYLTPPASGVKAFAFNFGDAVGIEEQLSNCKLSNCQMFDLSGRKVSSPTRGIYIQGTRKVIVK